MLETISAGPTTLFLIGSHTNIALFLMTNPRLKKNIEHIYIMGGGIRSDDPSGCCPDYSSSSCIPLQMQCGDPGNVFTAYATNPFAEFNIFSDPFAAYQVRTICSYCSLSMRFVILLLNNFRCSILGFRSPSFRSTRPTRSQ